VLTAVPLPAQPLSIQPLSIQPVLAQPLSNRSALRPHPPVSTGRHARAIRLLDVVVAGAALALLAPVLLAVAAAIKLFDPGPLLFAHKRLGQGGRSFHCLKFRSMTVDADVRLARLLETDAEARAEWLGTHKLRHDPRITPLGRFLRRSCLDELPQLVNVLRGEMSLVGPRPITAAEASRYGRYFPVYCSLKPGITGLWQVKRQDQTSYRRRVAFDLAYARSRSLALNLAILLLTVPSVLRGQGAC
jgi:exopolysaccharide production protein ExoY